MRNNSIRGEWAGCSHLKEKRDELLKAHQEFVDMLANGWRVDGIKVKSKRPRIVKAKQSRYVVTLVFGKELKMTIEEYNTKCQGFKKVREIF